MLYLNQYTDLIHKLGKEYCKPSLVLSAAMLLEHFLLDEAKKNMTELKLQ
jgi:hypothetical protein